MNYLKRWTFGSKVNLCKDRTLARIVQFYVWETPVPGASVRGRSFADYGWKSAPDLDAILSLFKQAGTLSDPALWAFVPNRKEVHGRLTRLDRLRGFDCTFEFAVHLRNGRKVESLLRFLRNSFAHGGFRICDYDGERYYALENKSNGQISGRAVLRESTLVGWESVIRNGPAPNLPKIR